MGCTIGRYLLSVQTISLQEETIRFLPVYNIYRRRFLLRRNSRKLMTHICLLCGAKLAGRSHKKFCSSKCRKQNYQQNDRAIHKLNAASSPTTKRQQLELFDLAMRLAESLYTLPPSCRLGYLEDLIQSARSGENPNLRRILTMPQLLNPKSDEPFKFWRRCPISYFTISQAADKYCMRYWKRGVIFVIRNPTYFPDTGLTG